MATVWIRSGLIAWLKGAPETRYVDTPLRGRPYDGDEPLYDQEALDHAYRRGFIDGQIDMRERSNVELRGASDDA